MLNGSESPTLEVHGHGAAPRWSASVTFDHTADHPVTSGALINAVEGCIRKLAQAAASGAFPSTISSVAPSLVAVTRCAQKGDTLELSLTFENCQTGCLQLLRSMIGYLRRDDIYCRHMRVSMADSAAAVSQTIAWPAEGADLEAYPRLAPPISSQLIAGSSSNLSKSRRMLVHMAGSVTADEVVRLRRAVAQWGTMLEGGAFAMPVGHPAVVDSVMGTVNQFDAETIEISVLRFMASEGAWASLANIVATTVSLPEISAIEVD